MSVINIYLLVFMNFFSLMVYASKLMQPKEHWYQEVWCKSKDGKIEYKLKDGRRVDCMTKKFAIEIEFARKWPEAIGQSLDYGMLTNKRAGIVLIIKNKNELAYWKRMEKLIAHYKLPITTWKLGP